MTKMEMIASIDSLVRAIEMYNRTRVDNPKLVEETENKLLSLIKLL